MAADGKASTPQDHSYRFVNKNAWNLGFCNPREAKLVKSYASAFSKHPLPPSRHHASATSHHNTGSKTFCWRPGSIPPPTTGANNHDGNHDVDSASAEDSVNQDERSTYQLSPVHLLQKGNSDPFAAASVEITPLASGLLNVWHGTLLEIVWPVEAQPPSNVWTKHGREIVASKTQIYALMTWALCLQNAALAPSPARLPLETKALIYKGRCISRLREELRQGATENLIQILWFLTGAEFYGGNAAASTTHFSAIRSVVRQSGGIMQLSPTLRHLLIAADMTLTQTRAIPEPAFPVDSWDPGPKLGQLSLEEFMWVVNSSQFSYPLHSEVPEALTDIFSDLRELLAIYNLAQSSNTGPRRTQLYNYFHSRQYALAYRVTDRRLELAKSLRQIGIADHVLEICACLALDYLLQLLWINRMRTRTKYALFHHPQPSLQEMLPDLATERPYLKLWIAFIAAVMELRSGLRDSAHGGRMEKQFLDAMTKIPDHPSATLTTILRGFIYDEALLQSDLTTLCHISVFGP